jgi:16S rRNA processing protein RimM
MGRVAASYAVRGWIKVQPFTAYVDSLLDYPVWRLGRGGVWREYPVIEAKVHGRSLLASLQGVSDRDAAEALRGMEIAVARAQLPPPEEGEYYWDQLIGLEVVNLQGQTLGRVEGLLETGAHDVLRIRGEREYLVPFVSALVPTVDLAARRIEVDWGLDY